MTGDFSPSECGTHAGLRVLHGMKPKIIFIHGMFLTGKSWEHWLPRFKKSGYDCTAPSWPLHNGEPAQLRANIPPGTGELSLNALVDHFSALAELTGEKPILIGHSLGGLVAQILVSRGLASAAVCISSVAPNAMLSVDWGFFRNSTQIANPLKGDKPFEMTEEGFHQNFGNMMSEAESAAAYQRYAVHESRNVLRDAMGKAGHIDLDQPHVPLLFHRR
jgi:pimeloyl-ACP methyl ester carboxylesterase